MRVLLLTAGVALLSAVPAFAQSPEAPEAEPSKLFVPGALLQGWAFFERAAPSGCLEADCVDNRSTLRLRRAELKASGEIVPGVVGYKLMLDLARATEMKDTTLRFQPEGSVKIKQPTGPVTVLQDVSLDLRAAGFEISAGQFKIPVSAEGYSVSSSKLLFPERSLVAREFGDVRDLGLKVSRRLGDSARLTAAVFNGAGQNVQDSDNAKDAALRLELMPLEGVTVALASYDTVGERQLAGTRDRWEADLRVERGALLVHGEVIRARDRVAEGEGGVIHSWGATAALGYTIAGRLQPALRYSRLDPQLGRDVDPAVDGGVDELHAIDVGVNYLLRQHQAKLQLAFQAKLFDQRPSTLQTVLAAQVGF